MEVKVIKHRNTLTLKADITANQQRFHFIQKTMQSGATMVCDL